MDRSTVKMNAFGLRLHISRGFVVMLALLLWMDEGVSLLLPALAACAAHECGHIAAIRCMGLNVKRVHLTAIGAEIVMEEGKVISYWKEMLIHIAGPLFNFLCAIPAMKLGGFLFAGMSLGQGIFNMLPALPLDGGKTLCSACSFFFGPERAERIMVVLSAATTGFLFGAALYVFLQFGNLTLILVVLWLLSGLMNTGKKIEKVRIKKKIMLAKRRKA